MLLPSCQFWKIIQSNHMSRLCQLPDAVILILLTLVLAYTWKISTYLMTYWAWSVATYCYWVHFWEISTIWSWSSLYVGKILAGLSTDETRSSTRLDSIERSKRVVDIKGGRQLEGFVAFHSTSSQGAASVWWMKARIHFTRTSPLLPWISVGQSRAWGMAIEG